MAIEPTLYHRGSPVPITAKVYIKEPYEDGELKDPTTIKITIYKKVVGAAEVEDANMEKKETGKYYYIAQTDDTWEAGLYDVMVEVTYGSYSDTTIKENCFELI